MKTAVEGYNVHCIVCIRNKELCDDAVTSNCIKGLQMCLAYNQNVPVLVYNMKSGMHLPIHSYLISSKDVGFLMTVVDYIDRQNENHH